MSIVIGTVGEPQGRRNGWSQTLGHFVEYTWKGTSSYALQIMGQLVGNCAEVDADTEGPSGTVRARFVGSTEAGGEEQVRIDIRRSRNDVQKSIFEAGPDGYGVGGISAEELRQIRALIDDNSQSDDQAYTDWILGSTDNGILLYNLALSGVEYRIVSQYIVTQVTTASSLYQWANMDGDANTIFTRSSMIATLSASPSFNIPVDPGTAPSGFNYGWRLAPPTYEDGADGTRTETLEFEFGLWSTLLYGVAS
jgi:hypothetical protein